jgi:diguanylate cyclase (GGDEF)-like protein
LLILLRRTLLVRLGDLAISARRWSHGEWTHRAAPGGSDEIAELGRAFNQMADELLRTSAALAEQHAAQELRLLRQAALLQMAHGFAATTNLDRLLDDIVKQAVNVLHAEYGSLTRHDDAKDALVTVRWTIPGAPLGGIVDARSVAALTAARRRPTIVNQYADAIDPALPAHRAGVKAVVAVPLFHDDRLIGTLGVSTTAADVSFTDADIETLELLGSLAAATLIGREREEQLRARAATDPLTGLANRRHATEQLDRLLSLATRRSDPLAVAMLDLDYFKTINDQYGHAAGDDVLRRLAVWIREAFRTEDVVARWGGEEFVLGMYGSTAVSGAQRLSSVLKQFHDEPFISPDGTSFQVTYSAGIAELARDGTTIDALCAAADRALYAAKAAGRATVKVASPRVKPHVLRAVKAG